MNKNYYSTYQGIERIFIENFMEATNTYLDTFYTDYKGELFCFFSNENNLLLHCFKQCLDNRLKYTYNYMSNGSLTQKELCAISDFIDFLELKIKYQIKEGKKQWTQQ